MPVCDDLLSAIETLDPLPITAQRLIGMLGNDNIPLQNVVDVVENDPAVAANILRMANSPLYGGRFKVERLRDAVVRLGTTALLDIAMGGYLRKLSTKAPLYDLGEDELWLHSAVAGLAVQELSREAKNDVPGSAQIAALVHDIGKLIMVRYRKVHASVIIERCQEKGWSFIEAERDLFGCDHAEIGGAVARAWDFPEAIAHAIAHHHDSPLEEGNATLDAVVAANFVTKTIGVGLGAEGLNLRIDQGCLVRLGVDFDAFCRACARTAARLGDLRKAYGLN